VFTVISSVPINPDGEPVRLTPEQVWRGLQIRARNGDDRFVPPGHRFEVVDDQGDVLTRRVYLEEREDELQRISFHGGRVAIFDFIEGGQRSVIVSSIETDDDGEYLLKFTYLVEFLGLDHGSEEELELARDRRQVMTGQPGRVLEVVRELASEGKV
jgi:Domain of unknown function (DUF1857)